MSEVVAVYGGSFNPPHLGHSLAAAYVLSACRVDRLLVIPTASHAFDKQLAPFEHRLQMCRLATSHLKHVEVSPIESELGGVNRTFSTLTALASRMPNTNLRLVIGSDLVAQLPTWHRTSEILTLAPLLVVQRSGYITDPTLPAIPEVSSTELRARLEQGLDSTGKLCPAVADYIHDHGLYKNSSEQ